MLVALLLAVAAGGAAAACPQARVVAENGEACSKDFDNFYDAFRFPDGVFTRRIHTAMVTDGYVAVRSVPLDGNTTSSWRMAISDGDGEFFALSSEKPSLTIPMGTYGVVIDVLSRPPAIYFDGAPARWDACASSVEPEPPCPLLPKPEEWGVRTTANVAPRVDFDVRVVSGSADVVGINVQTSRNATVEVLSEQGGVLGTAYGTGPLRVIFKNQLRVGTEAVRLRVRSKPAALETDDPAPSSPRDGAFASSGGGPRFVGSVISSLRHCPGAVVSSKLMLTTTRPATLTTVQGWDPDTVPVGKIRVFMSPSTDPDVVTTEAMKDLLTVIDTTDRTCLVRLTNVVINNGQNTREQFRNCVGKIFCFGTKCPDPNFRDPAEWIKRITFNFADVDTEKNIIYQFTGDLWIGIQTDLELNSGIDEEIRTKMLECGFTPPSSLGPEVVQVRSFSGSGGEPPPTRADVIIYASPKSDRNLFRDYATAMVLLNRITVTDAPRLQPGIMAFGDFEPLDGFTRTSDSYSFVYSTRLFAASGGILAAMVLSGSLFGGVWSKIGDFFDGIRQSIEFVAGPIFHGISPHEWWLFARIRKLFSG